MNGVEINEVFIPDLLPEMPWWGGVHGPNKSVAFHISQFDELYWNAVQFEVKMKLAVRVKQLNFCLICPLDVVSEVLYVV